MCVCEMHTPTTVPCCTMCVCVFWLATTLSIDSWLTVRTEQEKQQRPLLALSGILQQDASQRCPAAAPPSPLLLLTLPPLVRHEGGGVKNNEEKVRLSSKRRRVQEGEGRRRKENDRRLESKK